MVVALVAAQALVAAHAALTVTPNKTVLLPGQTLVLSGTANPGALIVIKVTNPQGKIVTIAEVSAGSDGKFTWNMTFPTTPTSLLVPGTYTILVKNVNTGETQTVTVTYKVGGVITGMVVNEEGQPISGAKVYLCSGMQVVATATTGSDGSFMLYASSGTYCLKVEAAGYLPFEKDNITVTSGKSVNLGTITLVSYATKIKQLENTVMKLESQLAALNNTFTSANKTLAGKVAALEKEVMDMNNTLASLKSEVAAVNMSLAGKASKADVMKLEDQLSKLQNQIGMISSQLGNISKAIASLKTQISGINKAVSMKADKDTVEMLSSQLKSINSTIKTIESQISNLNSRVKTLEAAMQTLSNLQSALKSLQNSVNAFQQTAQSLQNRVSSAASKASSASTTATIGVIVGIIGIIIAIIAVVLVYKKMV
jgi:predicted  nucleic acid-binding Zn-ribbon protein